MTGQDDPLDSFKPSGAPPQPSEVEFREAEAQLLAAIDLEMTRSKRRSRAAGWRLPAIAATVAVALGLFAVLQPDPARAALLEVARAARLATPIDIPSGSYVYSRSENVHLVVRPGSDMNLNSESVAYLLPTIREVWWSPAERFIQIRTTVQRPTFFSPGTAAAYRAAGLERDDGVGETDTQQLTGVTDPLSEAEWPTEARALRSAMEEAVSMSDDQRPIRVRVLDLAADLLRDADRTPILRSAILEVMADVGYDIVEDDGTISLSARFRNPLLTRLEVTLSRTGLLLVERTVLLEPDTALQIPANTVI
jgi:hypothetical protein